MREPSSTPCRIAVIGMACEYPGAHSPEELWQNILAGRRYFRKAPPERLPPAYFDPDPNAPGKSYCDQMAVLTGWRFDPVEFRLPPITIEVADMTHWLALHTARAAIQDAGLDLATLDRSRVGVLLGNSLAGEFSRSHNLRFRWPYVERSVRAALERSGLAADQIAPLVEAARAAFEAPLPEITEDTLAGNMSNTIAGRICHYFDLGGGGFTVDGACASSLLSVALACEALARGDLDIALAGGVDLSLDPFEIVGFAKTRALATEDIRPYDEHAQGMLTGEGCGLLVLAREADARAAGREIHALLCGWGYASDGATSGITAPAVEGQQRALRRAYERAGYAIGTVGYFEGHGTGTPVGDKVELTALRGLLEEGREGSVAWIGSLKANIGHCKAAAGVAGLIKAVKALERRIIPPTVNCLCPSAAFGVPPGRLRPSLEGGAWDPSPTPRRAGVSSMGFGGINAHVTIEEAEGNDAASLEDLALLASAQSSELVVLAADSLDALRGEVVKLLPIVRRICRAELTDLSAALTGAARAGRLRLACVADAPWTLAAQLEVVVEKLGRTDDPTALDAPGDGVFASEIRASPKWVALFPGQGSQRLNMGAHWLRRFPLARDFADRCERSAPGLQRRIQRDLLTADPAQQSAWEAELRTTEVAQPAVVLTSLLAWRVLEFFGLRPHAVLGHSLGEISALAAAGVCGAETAVRLAALRGEAMARLPEGDHGAMLAVQAPPQIVGELMELIRPALVISNFNSPRQTVVSGPAAAINELGRCCEQRALPCRRLPVSHAFHSGLVAPAAGTFQEAIGRGAGEGVAFGKPETLIISTVTGEPLPPDSDWEEYLGRQIRQPVRFVEAVLCAAEEAPDLWIEVGPGRALTGFLRDIFSPVTVRCLPTDLAEQDGYHLLNQVLARAWTLGFPVRLDRLFAHRFHRAFDLSHFDPQFIVNPCERLAVGGTDHSEITMVPRGTSPSTRARQPAEAPPPAPAAAEGTDQPSASPDTLLAFALEWIARRTGFPAGGLRPEQRLRDDLNLDSIKVSELVLVLARRAGGAFDADPTSVANARIHELVEAVVARCRPSSLEPKQGVPGSAPERGIAEWIRTFRVETRLASLEPAEAPLELKEGTWEVVAPPDCPRGVALAQRLANDGSRVQHAEADQLLQRGEPPRDLTGLLLVLPEVEAPFFALPPEGFDRRVGGLAATLFRLFRWAGHGTDWSRLRGLVLRPTRADDPGADLDGGAGFLKTLALEFPETNFKWLALPASWTPAAWAETALEELRRSRRHIGYTYTEDGRRWTEAAELVDNRAEDRAGSDQGPLGPEDVVLVTGGAKGITAELALALGQHTRARFALLGSSPAPAQENGAGDNEIRGNLRRFRAAGVQHLYVQADVTDLNAVRAAVHAAEAAFGPVTGILHGAGVTKPRLFRDQDLGGFLESLRVKARGLYNLLAAVPSAQLKALHVVTSVLGHTGMPGQSDYTLANAWLASALRAFQQRHPGVHCLALGFTAWEETGLARKLGAVANLRASGVTPIGTGDGAEAYVQLAGRRRGAGVHVITGRLSPPLEAMLFSLPPGARGRYLERVRRQVPGVEHVAEATLSAGRDLYLPEHVFGGTPVFPGVMAIEALVQAAQACAGRTDLPVLRDVEFDHPLVVPEGGQVVMRTLALADPPARGVVRVRTAIRSEVDGFIENHFAAECLFGERDRSPSVPAGPAPFPEWPEPLANDPESYHPIPLFQGRFFRRIRAIRKLVTEHESLTEIRVPEGEGYFEPAAAAGTATPSPVVRDACLQSGALILPPGCLPSHIAELRFHAAAAPGELVRCRAQVQERLEDTYVVDLVLRGSDWRLLETLQGLQLRRAGGPAPSGQAANALPLARLRGDLAALLPGKPQVLTLVNHREVEATPDVSELRAGERAQIERETSPARRRSVLASLVAVRRGSRELSCRPGHAPLDGPRIRLDRGPDGRPALHYVNEAGLATVPAGFQGVEVSLADSRDWSVAWLAPGPAGADIEFIQVREAERWRSLLSAEGYTLALRLAQQSDEPFDWAATRVWTLREACQKARGRVAAMPRFEGRLGGPWLLLVQDDDPALPLELYSVVVDLGAAGGGTAALALGTGAPPPATGESARTAHGEELDALLVDFVGGMRALAARGSGDPDAEGSVSRHAEFLALIAQTVPRLQAFERRLGAAELAAAQGRFQQALLPLLEGSQNFRHALLKPFGHAGDHALLALLVGNACTSRGLAWHFDRAQLDDPAAEACRQRVAWIAEDLASQSRAGRPAARSILDLGIGAAPVEQRLRDRHAVSDLLVCGVDFEPAALECAARVLAGAGTLELHRLNLREPAVLPEVGALAAKAEACVLIGLLEALTDLEAHRLLQAVWQALPKGAQLYADNFVPTHSSRTVLEWFLDFHLVYRTTDGLCALAANAGIRTGQLAVRLDPTGSVTLLKAVK